MYITVQKDCMYRYNKLSISSYHHSVQNCIESYKLNYTVQIGIVKRRFRPAKAGYGKSGMTITLSDVVCPNLSEKHSKIKYGRLNKGIICLNII